MTFPARNDAITLHVDAGFQSPYAMAAYVALIEKKLPFEVKCVDLSLDEHLADGYGRVSFTRRVPTLVHGAFSVSESSAICEYLEDIHPTTPIYPSNHQERARAREVQAWIRSDFAALRSERSTAVVFAAAAVVPLSAQARVAAGRFLEAAERLLPRGADKLFGQWCIADVELALMIRRLALDSDGVSTRLRAFADVQWARGSVRHWLDRTRLTCGWS